MARNEFRDPLYHIEHIKKSRTPRGQCYACGRDIPAGSEYFTLARRTRSWPPVSFNTLTVCVHCGWLRAYGQTVRRYWLGSFTPRGF